MPASHDAVHPALSDPRIEAFGMLVEAHNEVTNAVSRRLEDGHDLPVGWMGVLIRLARSPDQQLRMTKLARDMTISTSGLTRLIDRMERAGHVERKACPEDRRGLLAALTPKGEAVVAEAAPAHVADIERYLATPLSDTELRQLTDLLRIVRDHVRTIDDAPA